MKEREILAFSCDRQCDLHNIQGASIDRRFTFFMSQKLPLKPLKKNRTNLRSKKPKIQFFIFFYWKNEKQEKNDFRFFVLLWNLSYMFRGWFRCEVTTDLLLRLQLLHTLSLISLRYFHFSVWAMRNLNSRTQKNENLRVRDIMCRCDRYNILYFLPEIYDSKVYPSKHDSDLTSYFRTTERTEMVILSVEKSIKYQEKQKVGRNWRQIDSKSRKSGNTVNDSSYAQNSSIPFKELNTMGKKYENCF